MQSMQVNFGLRHKCAPVFWKKYWAKIFSGLHCPSWLKLLIRTWQLCLDPGRQLAVLWHHVQVENSTTDLSSRPLVPVKLDWSTSLVSPRGSANVAVCEYRILWTNAWTMIRLQACDVFQPSKSINSTVTFFCCCYFIHPKLTVAVWLDWCLHWHSNYSLLCTPSSTFFEHRLLICIIIHCTWVLYDIGIMLRSSSLSNAM